MFAPWFVHDGLTVLETFPAAFLIAIPLPDRGAVPNLESVENGEEDEQERFAKKIAVQHFFHIALCIIRHAHVEH